MQILMIDNYDSFTYNLVHMLEAFKGVSVVVKKNDEISLDEVLPFEKIVLSPGPGIPSHAGVMPALVKAFSSSKSILGVCLGHQCIAETFGASLLNTQDPIHGKSTPIEIVDPDEPLFRGLPPNFRVGRYHSWVVSNDDFPTAHLRVTARDGAQRIMGIRHNRFDVSGVQFHPESILSEHGSIILGNFLDLKPTQ